MFYFKIIKIIFLIESIKMTQIDLQYINPVGLIDQLIENDYGDHPIEIIEKIKFIKNELPLYYFIDDESFSNYLNDILLRLDKTNINYKNFNIKSEILNYIIKESKYERYILIGLYIKSLINDEKPVTISPKFFSMDDEYDMLFYHLLISYIYF